MSKMAAKVWRIIFFGSSEFSLPSLEALNEGPDEIVLVICPTPAKSGRGQKLNPSPLAIKADELGLSKLETNTVKSKDIIQQIKACKADLLVVAAYGGFLPKELLELCPHPPLNVHPSLLPRHRGAAPVNWSLIACDQELGVSVIFLEEEMDAGPILRQRAFKLNSGLPSAAYWIKYLAKIGAEELMQAIDELKKGTAQARLQNHDECTINPLLCKKDGLVDFKRPAHELLGLINGVDPWPGAQSTFRSKSLKIFGASLLPQPHQHEAGMVLGLDDEGRLIVATGKDLLLLNEIQPEGKKRMSAADFCRGYQPEKLG